MLIRSNISKQYSSWISWGEALLESISEPAFWFDEAGQLVAVNAGGAEFIKGLNLEADWHCKMVFGDFRLWERIAFLLKNDNSEEVSIKIPQEKDKTTKAIELLFRRLPEMHFLIKVLPFRGDDGLFEEWHWQTQALFNKLPSAKLAIDENGRFLSCNPAFFKLLGYWPDDQGDSEAIWNAVFPNADYRKEVVRRWQLALAKARMGVDNTPLEPYYVFDSKGRRKTVLCSFVWLGEQCLVSFTDITEQMNLQEALSQSERKYRIVAENTLHWEFWISPYGEPLYHSPACETITGYTPDWFCRELHLFEELLTAEDRKRYRKHMAEVHELKKSSRLVLRIRNRNGEFRIIEHLCKAIFDENGDYLGIRGTNVDFTEHHMANEMRRKLAMAVDQSPTSVVITNVKGLIEYVNPKFTEVSGYAFEEVIGKNPRFLKSDFLEKTDYAQMWRTIGGGQVWKGVFRNRKKNGDLYWESATISPIVNEAGKISHYIAVKEDITQKKATEEALVESESRYNSMLWQTPAGIVLVHNWRVFFANYAACRILGVADAAEVVGKSIFDYLEPEVHMEAKKLAADLLNGRPVQNPVVFAIRNFWGGHTELELSLSLQLHQQQKAVQIIMADLSERHRQQEAIETRNQLLKDIAWTHSHTLRAPLARLMGLVNIIVENDYDLISSHFALKEIVSSADALDKIIHDISDKTNLLQDFESELKAGGVKNTGLTENIEVLLIDDDPVVQLINKALITRNLPNVAIQVFMEAAPALAHLYQKNHENSKTLVLLDINMPEISGWDFLNQLCEKPALGDVQIIMLTSSIDMQDRVKAGNYDQVMDYWAKPLIKSQIESLRTNPKLRWLNV